MNGGHSESDCSGALQLFNVTPLGIHVSTSKAQLAVLVSSSEGVLVDEELQLEYEEVFPNGPSCPPVCMVAEVRVNVS